MSIMHSSASFEGKHGAGLYGGNGPTHKTTCPNSNNPYGHSADCPRCKSRPDQTVPYDELIDDLAVNEYGPHVGESWSPTHDHPASGDCSPTCPIWQDEAAWERLREEKNKERPR